MKSTKNRKRKNIYTFLDNRLETVGDYAPQQNKNPSDLFTDQNIEKWIVFVSAEVYCTELATKIILVSTRYSYRYSICRQGLYTSYDT